MKPPPTQEFLEAFWRVCADFDLDHQLKLLIPQQLRDNRWVDSEDRIRAGYSELAAGPGEWVDLTALRPLLGGASKAEVDEALVRMLAAPDVHLEPEPFGHRIGPAERRAAVHVGGEDRHKLAIGL